MNLHIALQNVKELQELSRWVTQKLEISSASSRLPSGNVLCR
jgi:hypothetical protein